MGMAGCVAGLCMQTRRRKYVLQHPLLHSVANVRLKELYFSPSIMIYFVLSKVERGVAPLALLPPSLSLRSCTNRTLNGGGDFHAYNRIAVVIGNLPNGLGLPTVSTFTHPASHVTIVKIVPL